MTTISYRQTGKAHGSHFFGASSYAHISDFAHKLAARWHRWQTAREIESMPFDIRKDIGWPAADINDEPKAMQ
ncbi:hypothetical protein [Rhizobium sp. BK251]|uniref:hypothetical protein n=1 Tax=Rhizobium sp. BK251 TaxID=2512125 RepID=UPI00104D5971|nr:hypothetical protein [Rhizobium sp. BK251]TCL73857.1 hypothetical protein EV286_103391 [Rhizobium sp. BK251]